MVPDWEDPDHDPLEQPTEEIPFQGHPKLGVWIMCFSLVALFWVGFRFEVFGNPLTFDRAGPYLFFGAIWLGIFGLGRSFFSAFTAFRITVGVAGVYLLIFFAGRLSRGEL